MLKISSFTMIKKLLIIAGVGIILSACANTMEGVGRDLQTMGNSMGASKTSNTATPNTSNTSNQSQTQGKDVVVTPVK